MALKTNETATLFSQKKLLGKAHTSNLNLDVNESIGSTIQSSAGLLFGEAIPTNPSLTLNTVQSSTVEYVEFVLEVIPGSTYDANDSGGGAGSDSGESSQVSGPHAYAFKFKSDYETDTDNSKAGDGNFDNDKIVHETLGKVQLIPPFYSRELVNPFIIKIYEDDGTGNAGTEIPLLDDIDWQVDTYNGVLFVQDYNASKIPAFARAFIYVGKMLDEVVSDASGSGGTGDPDASYLVLSSTGSLNNERTLVANTGLLGVDQGANSNYLLSIDDSIVATLTGSVFSGNIVAQSGLSGSLQQLADGSSYLVAGENITIATGSNGQVTISATTGVGNDASRKKHDYEVTSEVTSGSIFIVSNTSFSEANFDPALIDVYRNGQLLFSGSDAQVGTLDADYFVVSDTQLKFGHDLLIDDVITVSTYGTESSINRDKQDYDVLTDVLSGSIFDVANSNFSTANYKKTLIDVFHNGQLLFSGSDSQVGTLDADYFAYSASQIKFGFDIYKDDVVSVAIYTDNSESADANANYLVTSATDNLDNERVLTAGTGLQSSDAGAGGAFTISVEKEMVFNEKLGGTVDGNNTLFTLANTPFATNEISIFVNGQLQAPPDLTTWQDYSVTGSNVYFTTGSTPEAGSLILAMYNKVVS